MNKIVIVGTPFFNYTQSVYNAFVRENYKAVYFKFPKHSPKLSKIFPFNYFFKLWFMVQLYYLFFQLKRCVNKNDTLLFFGINYFSKDKLLAFKKRFDLKIILWFIDSIYSFEKFNNIITIADIIYTYNKHEVENLKAYNAEVKFIPLMCDSQYYFPKSLPKTIDLYFIGSLSKRMDFFEELLKKIEKYDYNIIIDGTYSRHKLRLKRKQYPFLYKYYRGHKLTASEINDMYNRSKLCINIQPEQATSALNIRTFEIAGSGALQITNGNKEIIEKLFRVKREILYFIDIVDLTSKLKDIIDNYPDYKNIESDAYKKVINEHTTDMRIRTIISNLNNL